MMRTCRRRYRIAIILLAALLVSVGVLYGLLVLSRSRTFQLFGEIVARVDTPEKVVALTFDDGPTPGFTDEILRVLAEEETSATFFLVGKDVKSHGGEARAIADAGHEIGNHSWSHRRMVLKSPAFVKQEIEMTDTAIAEAGYTSDTVFRPPYGKKLVTLPWYLSATGRTTVTWDVEPESFPEVAASPEAISKHVMEKVKPGSIILLHVMYDKERKSLKAVRPIIRGLRDKGYNFLTISELLAHWEG